MWVSLQRVVDNGHENVRLHQSFAPGSIKIGGRPGGNDFLLGTTGSLELLNTVPDRRQHVAVFRQRSPITQRSVTRDDTRFGVRRFERAVDCRNHAVDAAAGGGVNERVLSVEERIAHVQHVPIEKYTATSVSVWAGGT